MLRGFHLRELFTMHAKSVLFLLYFSHRPGLRGEVSGQENRRSTDSLPHNPANQIQTSTIGTGKLFGNGY